MTTSIPTTLPARRRPGGRPTKFTAQTRKRILRCIRRGMPLTLAASAAGVSYSSLCNFRARSKSFEMSLASAIAKGVNANLEVIEQATRSQDQAVRLRAACWFLEHTQPQHFARNRLELTGADGQPLDGRIVFLAWPHQQNQSSTPHEHEKLLNATDIHPA